MLLNTHEVAALLNVHPKHVYRLLRKGLPARRVGGEWRFDRDEVFAWSGGPAPASGIPSLVAANGDRAALLLLRHLADSGLLLGLVQADQGSALELLAARKVLAGGLHAGGFPGHVGGERVARIHLVTREVGVVSRRPLRSMRGLRIAARAPTAGVHRYQSVFGARPRRMVPAASHVEVVCAVARGDADAGIASRAWAEAVGLVFKPLAREAYGLLVRASDLGDKRVVRICEVAQSAAFRAEAARMPGYDVLGAGDIRYDSA